MSAPLRVALVVPSLRGGGLERVVRDLATQLQATGAGPAVFTLDGLGIHADALVERGIEVHDCSESGWRIRGIPGRLIKALWKFGPDVIHAHSGTWLPAVVSRLALGSRPSLIYTEHGRYPPEPRGRAALERQLARCTTQIVTVSDSVADYLTQFLALPDRPVVIPNGIDLAPYAVDRSTAREFIRRSWNIPADAVVVIAVGRFAPVKNHAGMLRAFQAASSHEPSLRLVLLGAGPLETDLRSLSSELGVTDRVVFAGFRQDVPDCLSAADCWLCASQTEGLPIALLEGMAAGLAIVSYHVGGIPAATLDAGWIVPQGDEAALGQALVTMARDRLARERSQHRARELSQSYSLAQMTARYRLVYSAESG